MSDTLSLTTPVTVAGGGSWGTALAHLLAARGLPATLWLRDAEVALAVNERHENPRYLPGFALDARLAASTDPAVLNRDLLVLAVPSQQLRGWLGTHRTFFRPGPVLVNAAKGLETGSLATCGAVVAEALAGLEPRYSVLSGATKPWAGPCGNCFPARPSAVIPARTSPAWRWAARSRTSWPSPPESATAWAWGTTAGPR